MVSTCPSCKNQITHEDYLFEVACECGMRFNPFYDASGPNEIPPQVEAEPESAAPNFSESRTAFQEIVQFGETMEQSPAGRAVGPRSP